jgi:hypothetical protein
LPQFCVPCSLFSEKGRAGSRSVDRQQRAVSRAAEQQSSRAAVKCSKQSSRVDSKHRAWSPMKRRRKLRRGVWVVWGEGSGV